MSYSLPSASPSTNRPRELVRYLQRTRRLARARRRHLVRLPRVVVDGRAVELALALLRRGRRGRDATAATRPLVRLLLLLISLRVLLLLDAACASADVGQRVARVRRVGAVGQNGVSRVSGARALPARQTVSWLLSLLRVVRALGTQLSLLATTALSRSVG